MRPQRLVFSDHAMREMEKASTVQPVTRDMVSETLFRGVRKYQRRSRNGFQILQANRFYGERNLRVAFEDTPGACFILSVLWEGHYD